MDDRENILEDKSAGGTGGGSDVKDRQEDGYEKVCSICRRPESRAGEMVQMPGEICMCHDCMQKAFDSLGKSGMDIGKFSGIPFMNLNVSDITSFLPET